MVDPHCSRRESLKHIGLGAGMFSAGVATSLTSPVTEGRPSICFTIISDTHVGYKGKESAGKLWDQTAVELSQSNSEFILHLGDVIDGGRVDQYPIYLNAKEKTGKPVYEIPGNHDPAEAFAKTIRKEIDTVVEHGWLRCILLNNAHRDSHDGFFEPAQLDWLEKQLTIVQSEKQLALVCCHVPVHQNRHPDRGWYVKPSDGQTRFYEIMKRSRDVVATVVHGHFHNGIRGWNDHEFHEMCLPSALYNLNRGLEEKKAPGYNPLEFRPGYTKVKIGDGALELRYKPTGEQPSVSKSVNLENFFSD